MIVKDLSTAMKAIERIKLNAKHNPTVYASDSSVWQWYFAISGFSKGGRYFDFYFRKRDGKVTVEPAHNSQVSLKTMTRPCKR